MNVFVYLCDVSRNRDYLLTVLVQLGSDPALIQLLHGMTNERVILLGSCEQCQPCVVERRCVLEKKGGHQRYPDILMVSTSCIRENLVLGKRMFSLSLSLSLCLCLSVSVSLSVSLCLSVFPCFSTKRKNSFRNKCFFSLSKFFLNFINIYSFIIYLFLQIVF